MSYSVFPLMKGNLNIERDIEKPLIIYSLSSNLRKKDNFTINATRESKLIIDPNTQESIPNTGNSKLLIALGKQF